MRISLLSLLLLSLLFISCGTESTPTYILDVDVSPVEGGSVSPSVGQFDEGEQVSLTPTANENWIFEKWTGDVNSTSSSLTVTMDSDKSVIANFVKMEYPLNIEVEGNGEVTEQIIPQKSTDYDHGTVVELTPEPADGYEFVEWSGDLSGNEAPERIKIDGAKNVTATFEPSGTVNSRITYEYDSNNNLIEEFYYNSDGFIGYKYTYTYDANDNLTEEIYFNSDGSIRYRDTYRYDANNNLIEAKQYGSDGTLEFRDTYSYNTLNNLKEHILYDFDGSIIFRRIYIYDSENNPIERIEYRADGGINERFEWSYDNGNNLIERILYSADGTLLYRDTFSYDSNDNLIEEIYYGSDGSISYRWTYDYDSNNNLIERIQYGSDGALDYRDTFRYDSSNNLIETIFHNPNDVITDLFTHFYDDNKRIERVHYIYKQNKFKSTKTEGRFKYRTNDDCKTSSFLLIPSERLKSRCL